MSSESCPVLGGAIPAFKKFMMQWEALATTAPHVAPFIKARLERAWEYHCHMGQTCAYIMVMCKS